MPRHPQSHGVAARVPVVEVARHRHDLGVGGPHGEARTLDAIHFDQVRAECVVAFKVGALAVQMQFEVGELRRVPVRVVDLERGAVVQHGAQPIGARLPLQRGDEESLFMAFLHRDGRGVDQDLGGGRVRQKRAHQP